MGEIKTKFLFPAEDQADAPVLVTWPCKLMVPQDGGQHQAQMLDVRFKVLGQDEMVAAYSGGDASLYDAAVVSFPTLEQQGGGKPEDAKAKALLRARPYAVKGVLDGYFEMLGSRLPKN